VAFMHAVYKGHPTSFCTLVRPSRPVLIQTVYKHPFTGGITS
jgi:hypothetical protein